MGYSKFLAMKGKEDEILAKNSKVSGREARKMAKHLCVDVLRLVKLPDPQRILKQYPFELSGGMRQRAMIAMALARRPSLFIADEITTALDVTIQAQILHLMRELRDTIDASTLMITHDLAVAAEIADRIAVMYAGNVVELAETREVFRRPLHPYTKLLMKAIPNVAKPVDRLESMPGMVPDLINPPSGCRFHPRCPYAMDLCPVVFPETTEPVKGHEVACYLY
jgi:peptide/nickel transport system ATP-binding protein